MFPIYLHTDPEAVYPDEFCHIVANNGIFFQVNKPFYTAITSVSGPTDKLIEMQNQANNLIDIEESCQWTWSIPFDVFTKAINLQREVYSIYMAPLVVAVYYHEGDDEFHLVAPDQRAQSTSVGRRIKPVDGMVYVGEIVNCDYVNEFPEVGFRICLSDYTSEPDESRLFVESCRLFVNGSWLEIHVTEIFPELADVSEMIEHIDTNLSLEDVIVHRRKKVRHGFFGFIRNMLMRFKAFNLLAQLLHRETKSATGAAGTRIVHKMLCTIPRFDNQIEWRDQYSYIGASGLFMMGGPTILFNGREADVSIFSPEHTHDRNAATERHNQLLDDLNTITAKIEDIPKSEQGSLVEESVEIKNEIEAIRISLSIGRCDVPIFPPIHSIRRMAELANLMPIRGAIIGDRHVTDLNIVPPPGVEVLLFR